MGLVSLDISKPYDSTRRHNILIELNQVLCKEPQSILKQLTIPPDEGAFRSRPIYSIYNTAGEPILEIKINDLSFGYSRLRYGYPMAKKEPAACEVCGVQLTVKRIIFESFKYTRSTNHWTRHDSRRCTRT
ncbi:Uncharacterized protein FWK35_00028977 [Aphis craccivora]|uniref:Uncharacterized protein n=1 Tax=Aphis craccivora TaxID=307492 RepID=A0A6G0Y4Y6_APHCR|nr:Uncharacterized protein FWK35_00028977 [Aphis craccivora]